MIEAFTLNEELEGQNIRLLRRTHEFDGEMWQAVDANRDFLRQYLFWVDKTNSLDDVAAATKTFAENWAAQNNFAYVLLDKHSGRLLGCIDLHDIDLTNSIAAIGYWLKKDKTGITRFFSLCYTCFLLLSASGGKFTTLYHVSSPVQDNALIPASIVLLPSAHHQVQRPSLLWPLLTEGSHRLCTLPPFPYCFRLPEPEALLYRLPTDLQGLRP